MYTNYKKMMYRYNVTCQKENLSSYLFFMFNVLCIRLAWLVNNFLTIA